MAVKFDTAYPKEVTNSAWQKQKTIKDKISTKTKLGAALTKAESAWQLIAFKQMDLRELDQEYLVDADVFKLRYAAAYQQLHGPVAKGIQVLTAAALMAKEAKTNAELTEQAQTAAGNIELKLEHQIGLLKSISLQDFDLQKEHLERKEKLMENAGEIQEKAKKQMELKQQQQERDRKRREENERMRQNAEKLRN